MDRRAFVRVGLGLGVAGGLSWSQQLAMRCVVEQSPNANSFIPVVGDGDWIWTEPPSDEQGYLEPREFDLTIGIELRGTGSTRQLYASTAAPSESDGQRIESVEIDAIGCTANLRQLAPNAAQLFLSAARLKAGEVIGAVARYRLRVCKDFRAFNREMFPREQAPPKEFRKTCLYDSPGIPTRHRLVRETADQVIGQFDHPWDKAKAIHAWVGEHIEGRIQNYTNVVTALRERVGDCEERAATFVAFCRCAGIPARLVWVPNHNWAEFYLTDNDGYGHWIPAHTSAYSWFGWTGAHEVVLQKGDRINVPEKRRPQRLLADWLRGTGARPQVRYIGELTPVAPDIASDPGPGARRKDRRGAWNLLGTHPLDRYFRDGDLSDQPPPRDG